jgi:hypothetical protein
MFGHNKPSDITVDIKYTEKISRLFIFRCLWLIIAVWPLALLGLWFGILSFVHFWYMLILGERSKGIFTRQLGIIRFFASWHAYLRYFINGRPLFWPAE